MLNVRACRMSSCDMVECRLSTLRMHVCISQRLRGHLQISNFLTCDFWSESPQGHPEQPSLLQYPHSARTMAQKEPLSGALGDGSEPIFGTLPLLRKQTPLNVATLLSSHYSDRWLTHRCRRVCACSCIWGTREGLTQVRRACALVAVQHVAMTSMRVCSIA